MTEAWRRRIAWWIRGTAAAVLLLCVPGRAAAADGGRVLVRDWLDRPVLLSTVAFVLLLASLYIGPEIPTGRGSYGAGVRVGLVGAVGLCALAVLGVLGSYGGPPAERTQLAAPGDPGLALTETPVGGIDPDYELEPVTGSGWSARHWAIGRWAGYDGSAGGYYVGVRWTGPDRFLVLRDKKEQEFTVDPATGRVGEPVERPRAAAAG
ncbi:hypothetical protein [Streptomyces sp. TLI_171]|uniref:hypothetical protein n=1 Tax=Streptomyces sp. TLI_171 TaxID=1938859 RepID=UPI000C177714|nr:hypothetical protein [Streptomyces sp. TLI_171]RKE17034.1 hypothetical protein BX266_0285 [Streptomyces sp. TLI_171]